MLPSDKIALKQLPGTIDGYYKRTLAGQLYGDLGLSWHPVCICYLLYRLWLTFQYMYSGLCPTLKSVLSGHPWGML